MSSTLRALGPDLFTFEREVSVPGMLLPARCTVMRLPDGGLLLCSPLAIDDALAGELAALGPVRWLVAPNLLHHLFLGPAQARFPDARTLGAPGLAAKRADLRFDGVLGEGDPFDGAIDAQLVGGMPGVNEVALFHRSSRTLVLTDLLFNVRSSPHFSTRLLMTVVSGVYGRCAVSRMIRWMVDDRAAAAGSLEKVIGWAPERLIVAHGDPVETDVTPLLERELAWFFRGRPRA